MSTAPATRLLTAEEFYEFCGLPENDDKLFELEDGEIVEMPRPVVPHGVVCGNIAFLLGAYVRQRNRGYVCSNDTGIIWKRKPDTVRGPDVVYFEDNVAFDELPEKWSERPPLLAVEVRSPNDRMSKLQRRIGQFLTWGTSIVWLVDYEDRTVTVYRRNQFPQVYDENDELPGADELPALQCTIRDFFVMPGTPRET